MKPITHEAISASAGSGKTFQLAHRYIRLLAGGVKPERIIALTFSRKAAGEIFDSIITYLYRAATSPETARNTSEIIDIPSLCQNDFLRLLREMMNSLHRLQIGTLDSFTVGIIRSFPMELGISGAFQVMESEGALARTARQEVLGRIFNHHYVNQTTQREFLEAFKQATFGQEEKGLQRNLDTFIGEYHRFYHALPDRDRWGQPACIWPEGPAWPGPVEDRRATGERLRELIDHHDWPERVIQRWHDFLEAAAAYDSRSIWTGDIEYLTARLLEDLEGLREGKASLKVDRYQCDLSVEESGLALALLSHIMGTEITAALERTRGIYRVLEQYERLYDERVRQAGRLTFDEVQYLLTPYNGFNGGTTLSQRPDTQARLYIDYRLDCRLDHWLLDEFQDTSDLQWEAIQNLADEILQDTSGQRSFFYVGDVKQAIYGWRGGNARLFNSVLTQYGEHIRERPLSTSFRSCQPVIDAVNTVLRDPLPHNIPAGTARQWSRNWQEHECQPGHVPESGHVALIEPPSHGGAVKPDLEERCQAVAGLLAEIDPLNRGLSTAILVRSNESGRRVVDHLRRECPGLKIIHEGRAAISDNPVVSVLLSLVKFAAHPGDGFAWQHLRMSPLRLYMDENHLTRDNLPLRLLGEIQASGFQAFIRNWGEHLDRSHPLDSFGRQRLANLFSAAGEFDSYGQRDCASFLNFMASYQLHEPASDDAVRVMTIHQSKGLGFDMVILPDLQGRSMVTSGETKFVTARDPVTRLPVWALRMPRGLIARQDPVLSAQLRLSEEESCFDALCVLYVAMTRARQGLYLITGFPGKSSRIMDEAAFLKTQLTGEPKPGDGLPFPINGRDFTCLYQTGDRNWFTGISPQGSPPPVISAPDLPHDFSRQPSRRPRLARISPSEQVEHERRASELFAPEYYQSLDLGRALHQLLHDVSWIEDSDIEDIIRRWEAVSPLTEDLKARAAGHFRQTLALPEVRRGLARPGGNVNLWRERNFEVILDGNWVTGTFDRVIITRDADGRPVSARIIDFKSDDITADDIPVTAARYRTQLHLYARALARILGLEASRITLQLLFTRPGRTYDFE